jgi:hypothetical protein
LYYAEQVVPQGFQCSIWPKHDQEDKPQGVFSYCVQSPLRASFRTAPSFRDLKISGRCCLDRSLICERVAILFASSGYLRIPGSVRTLGDGNRVDKQSSIYPLATKKDIPGCIFFPIIGWLRRVKTTQSGVFFLLIPTLQQVWYVPSPDHNTASGPSVPSSDYHFHWCSYCAHLRLHHHLPGSHAQSSAEAMGRQSFGKLLCIVGRRTS